MPLKTPHRLTQTEKEELRQGLAPIAAMFGYEWGTCPTCGGPSLIDFEPRCGERHPACREIKRRAKAPNQSASLF